MKKTIPILALIGLGTWLIDWTYKNQKTKAANAFNLIPIQISGSNIDNLFLLFQITGAVGKSFIIDSLEVYFYYKENAIADVYIDTPTQITPTKSFFKLPINIPTPEIYYQLKKDIESKNIRFEKFKVIGSYKYKGLLFPVDREVKFYASK